MVSKTVLWGVDHDPNKTRTSEVLDKNQKDIDEEENEDLSAADCGRQGMLRLGRAEDRSAIDGRGTAR